MHKGMESGKGVSQFGEAAGKTESSQTGELKGSGLRKCDGLETKGKETVE